MGGLKSTKKGGRFGVVVAGVPVAIAGKISITTSCVDVAFPSDAKNFAVDVPRLDVATGIQENIPVDDAQPASIGSSVANESSSLSESVAKALNWSSEPSVVDALVIPVHTGGVFVALGGGGGAGGRT